MFHDTQTTIARLQALRELGIRIAIDDFGTGYSSLGYLRRFQVDILKIAREFIGAADGGSDEWAFARAIVALGRTLGLRIVAEGIEDAGPARAPAGAGLRVRPGLPVRPARSTVRPFTARPLARRRYAARRPPEARRAGAG